MITFNVPPCTDDESFYLLQVLKNQKISGDGDFTKRCSAWFEEKFLAKRVLFTTSGTSALEIAARLCKLKNGDEVILPSYTFCSTANAFVQCGAKLVFVDIRPDTMNIDESIIERAVTSKTKVIVPVHYAGVACEMDIIMDIARRHNLFVVEDAAQGVMSQYKDKYLGTIGSFGCYSFHETKNYSMGEGGAICLNDKKYIEEAEIIREKGTNRSKFYRGQIDKYTWIDYGSSYLPSELNVAYLYPQLKIADKINDNRLVLWNEYKKHLSLLQEKDMLELPFVPRSCTHNAHMFYIKMKNIEERTKFIEYMKERGANCVFHYIPLHSSPAGQKFGRFYGEDKWTTKESERLVRLPLWYKMTVDQVDEVCQRIYDFFK